MTEFGKSELFTADQLRDIGVNIVIYPVSLLRTAMGAVTRALDTLTRDGSLPAEVATMQTRAELYELLNYADYTTSTPTSTTSVSTAMADSPAPRTSRPTRRRWRSAATNQQRTPRSDNWVRWRRRAAGRW